MEEWQSQSEVLKQFDHHLHIVLLFFLLLYPEILAPKLYPSRSCELLSSIM